MNAHRGVGNVKRELEIGVTQPQPRNANSHQNPEKAKNRFSLLNLMGACSLANTLILASQY